MYAAAKRSILALFSSFYQQKITSWPPTHLATQCPNYHCDASKGIPGIHGDYYQLEVETLFITRGVNEETKH